MNNNIKKTAKFTIVWKAEHTHTYVAPCNNSMTKRTISKINKHMANKTIPRGNVHEILVMNCLLYYNVITISIFLTRASTFAMSRLSYAHRRLR